MKLSLHCFATAHRARQFARLLALLACAAPLGLMPGAAHAEQADKDKPLNVEADNLSYDDLKQINIFTGNVVLTKGTIIIKADRVEVHQDPQGYQYATGTSNGTTLAYFRQKRDTPNTYIQGNALRIDYDSKNDVTTLTGRGLVQKLQGLTVVADEVHGNVIRYDGQTDFYTATAGSDITAAPGTSTTTTTTTTTGRVHAMLVPQNTASAAVAGSGVPLYASPKIDGAPK